MNFKIKLLVSISLVLLFTLSVMGKGKKARATKQTPNGVSRVTASGLRCPPCEKIHCQRKRRRNCRGGLTTDTCGCCSICAKVEGQECGGSDLYLGKCDVGLQCIPHDYPDVDMYMPSIQSPTSITGVNSLKGTCQNHKGQFGNVQDQAPVCRPLCTPEYCRKRPNAICSASNNAIVSNDCRGECQHTGCSACYFQEVPRCQKCARNDFKCLAKFAKCTKKTTCTRNKYPCKKKLKRQQDGKFLCWVPECL